MQQGPGLADNRAHIIVVGNEKGGSGKTTTSMHLAVSLLRIGFRVGTVDIDARQRSFSRYLENRRQHMQKFGVELPMPRHAVVKRSPFLTIEDCEEDESSRFQEAINHLDTDSDFIIVDSPGADQFMARLAHGMADTVITPINDSFVDLDVLAHIDPDSLEIRRPSVYSEMLWEQKLIKAKQQRGPIDWVVMRNRLSNLGARNKERMAEAVQLLSRRIGFRIAPGFSERVIYRELFLQGLTVMDLIEDNLANGVSLSMSHIAAREEVRNLLKALEIESVDEALLRKDELERRRKAELRKQKQQAKGTGDTSLPPSENEPAHELEAEQVNQQMEETVESTASPSIAASTEENSLSADEQSDVDEVETLSEKAQTSEADAENDETSENDMTDNAAPDAPIGAVMVEPANSNQKDTVGKSITAIMKEKIMV